MEKNDREGRFKCRHGCQLWNEEEDRLIGTKTAQKPRKWALENYIKIKDKAGRGK